MPQKFGRLALHMWTIDTTPLETALDAAKQAGYDAVELRRTDFKRCFDAGMSNAQVLDLIKKSGIPAACSASNMAGCSPLARRASGSSRCSANLRECGRARCDTLMSAPGQVQGPITDAIKYLKDAGDIAAEYKLKLAIEYNSQHDVLNSLPVLTELITGANKPNCGYLVDAYHFTRSGFGGRGFEPIPADQIYLLPIQRPVAQPGDRRAAADRPAAARQGRGQMARDARAVGGKRLYRVSQLRSAQPRPMGALAL